MFLPTQMILFIWDEGIEEGGRGGGLKAMCFILHRDFENLKMKNDNSILF